jgi:hypothetical protein
MASAVALAGQHPTDESAPMVNASTGPPAARAAPAIRVRPGGVRPRRSPVRRRLAPRPQRRGARRRRRRRSPWNWLSPLARRPEAVRRDH